MKKDKIFGIVFAIIGVLIALGPKLLFPVCAGLKDDGTPMKCFYTSNVTLGLGLGIVMFGIMLCMMKEVSARIISTMGVVFMSVMTYLTTHVLIGVCKTATMPCKMLTLPALNILSIGLILLVVIYTIAVLKENKKEER